MWGSEKDMDHPMSSVSFNLIPEEKNFEDYTKARSFKLRGGDPSHFFGRIHFDHRHFDPRAPQVPLGHHRCL